MKYLTFDTSIPLYQLYYIRRTDESYNRIYYVVSMYKTFMQRHPRALVEGAAKPIRARVLKS